jgi:hypothetical protein
MEIATIRQVIVDDTDPSITFVGDWGHDQGLSGIASSSDDRLGGPAYNNTSTFAEKDLGLEFTFTGLHQFLDIEIFHDLTSLTMASDIGTEISLYGGINFVPSGTFGTCALDAVTDNSTSLMIANGVVGTNNNLLCTYSGLSDNTHMLTFNLGSIGSYPSAPGADGSPNRVWVDRVVYTPSASVALDTAPAVMIFPGDPSLEYSTGWETDIYDDALTTSVENGSVMFTFQGMWLAGFVIHDLYMTSLFTLFRDLRCLLWHADQRDQHKGLVCYIFH